MEEKPQRGPVTEREMSELQPLYRDLDEIDLNQLLQLMREPVQAIDTVISKADLRKTCKQLLAQNLTLQKKLARLTS